MKRLLSTVLLAFLVMGVWAQNKMKMTEEEKKEAMEQLEVLYQFETGEAFSEFDLHSENTEFKQDILPWEKWADKFKHKSFKNSLSRLFMCFDKAFIEPNKDSPIFCNLMLRGKDEDVSSYFGSRQGSGLWKKYYHEDENGNFTGFCKELFFDLKTDLQLHLTDKQSASCFVYLQIVGRFLQVGLHHS